MVDRLVRLDRKIVEDAAFRRVKRHPEELLLNQTDFRDGQRNIHIGLESDGHAVAVGALDGRLVQPVHQVDNHGLVAL